MLFHNIDAIHFTHSVHSNIFSTNLLRTGVGACVHGQEIEYLSVCFLDLNSLLNGKTNRN